MQLKFLVDGYQVCIVELWPDKAPGICGAIADALPIRTVLQHGKIVGDLLFCGTEVVSQAENVARLQDICWDRREQDGTAAGAICFYNPRQQICIYYGDDLADEPFEISYIGEVIEGLDILHQCGLDVWRSPGKIFEVVRA